MCFDTTKSQKPKIATEDIICYKRGMKLKGDRFEPSCQRRYIYEKDVIQTKIILRKKDYYGNWEINEGYHSFIKRPERTGAGKMQALFIIPKGTRYYENKTANVRVSETIIFKEILKAPPRDYRRYSY